jgi:hypothetical protein
VNVSSRCINPTIKDIPLIISENLKISRAKYRVIYGGYWKGEASESEIPWTDSVCNKTERMIAEKDVKRLRKPEGVANSSEVNLR